MVEHGYDQGPACRLLFEQAGLQQVHTLPDLAGLDRVTLGCQP
jgi:release factor glutamine methyltransferase